MKKILKRFFALLLVANIFCILPTTVFAGEITGRSASALDTECVVPPIPDMEESEYFVTKTSDDGYVKITIYREPIAPTDDDPYGFYYAHIWVDWLKNPTYRKTDTLSVDAPSFTLATATEQYSVMTYTTTDLFGNTTEHVREQNHYMYKWDLPNSAPWRRISNIRIYLCMKLYVTSPTKSQLLQSNVTYTHVRSLFNSGWLSKKTTYSLLSPAMDYEVHKIN